VAPSPARQDALVASLRGSLVTDTLAFDGGRGVTASLPQSPWMP